MKILFTIGNMDKGGAERVVANLSNFLAKDNIVAIATTLKCESKYELDKKILMYSLDDEKNINRNKISKNIFRIKSLHETIKSFQPDIIISFLPEPSYRVLFLKRFNKIPVLVSVRNDPNVEYKSIVDKLVMKSMYPLADGFVFQTEDAKKYFCDKIQKKSTIIPNPIKEEFTNRVKYEGEKEKVIVSVGRLDTQKNFKLLIEAFNEFSMKNSDYDLIIYGEGKLRNELEQKIKELKLENRVHLPGLVDNVAEKIEKASLFVLSSDYEGMPNALMEAMALGLPCISTDCPCGGPNFLIKNDYNGILVPVGDKERLALSMNELINNIEKANKISENARKISIELNTNEINKKWKKYINEI